VAVDPPSPCNADYDGGFSGMNNIINDSRSLKTASNAANLLFIIGMRPPSQTRDPDPKRQNMVWKWKKSSSLNKWHVSSNFEKG